MSCCEIFAILGQNGTTLISKSNEIRTGSGKSSFLLALLRIVPPEPGSRILLDDVDLSQVSLCTLRTRLSMIPQDPVLFTGTLRYNLDPFGAYDDETLLTAISDARIDASRFQQMSEEGFKEEEDDPMLISGPEFGVLLNSLVEEGGKNFSVGERQLLCLARAVVRNSRLVLLDEATSAVDYDLDKLVQETIRDTFRASTVIAIAHRLNTVLDYDRVIVMDRGEVVEDGSPKILLENPSSKFAKMAAAYADGAAS